MTLVFQQERNVVHQGTPGLTSSSIVLHPIYAQNHQVVSRF